MFDVLYTAGLAMMARPVVPGCISLGAILCQWLRALDPDVDRADRNQIAAWSILDAHRDAIDWPRDDEDAG